MPRISALGQLAGELIPDLVAAIRRGIFFPSLSLFPIITRLKNEELLVCVLDQYGEKYLNDFEKCQLLKAGFVWEFQQNLLDSLYESFEDPFFPRCEIVDALVASGTSSSLETLKVIENRMSNLIQKYSSELDSAGSDEEKLKLVDSWLKGGDYPFRLVDGQEFLKKVKHAITVVGTRPNPEHIKPELARQRLQGSESNNQEFKSSLRWDLKQNKVNPALEQAVVKTIAAFGNSLGGTLWIGVDDKGKPIGLQDDYNSLKADKDKFERHLRNLISDSIGPAFGAQNVDVAFLQEKSLEICRVEVHLSSSRLFVKEGQNKVFYIRNGNSSVPLQGDEMIRYCGQRNPKFT